MHQIYRLSEKIVWEILNVKSNIEKSINVSIGIVYQTTNLVHLRLSNT